MPGTAWPGSVAFQERQAACHRSHVDSLEHIKAGRLRALAVLGPKRTAALPDVPTSAEAGYPDVQGVTFNGIFAPRQTPPAIVEKLSTVVREALMKPEVIEKLAALGSDARGSAPDEFRLFLQQETEKWSEVMKQAKIKVTQ